MRRSILFAIVAGLLAVSAPAVVSANSSAFHGAGGTVVPVPEERVRMVSERVSIREVDRDWRVEVRHVFRNTSDESVELKVGFPELACDGDHTCDEDEGSKSYGMKEFTVRVDGEEVETTTGQVDGDSSGEDWYERLDRVHLFDVTFPPDEKVVVDIDYRHPDSGGLDFGTTFTYLTKTGRLWKGDIERARFSIQLPHHYVAYIPAEFELVRRTHSPEIDGQVRYLFETSNWTPRDNFTVTIPNYIGRYPRSNCPPIVKISGLCARETAEKRRRFLYDYFLSRDDIRDSRLEELGEDWRRKQIRVCRNLPYALHGHEFEDDDLNEFFYKYAEPTDVYEASHMVRSPESGDHAGEEKHLTQYTLWPNPDFEPSLLTEREVQYVRAAKYAEEHLESLVAEFGGGHASGADDSEEGEGSGGESIGEAVCGD